ncbi:acid phosphatase [Pseudomonas protegens]|uniref:Acid phosphatase n=1 Tax=Pseudomonas protegens (strain DSM 19095 / LMG 27888 / CFBP 6595 / CHA0) TaxID=1124983 RepID=A0A2C9EGV4_PSEPH|nr:phosphatase PAP2 family protein [Pseudomonas protegens]AGL82809.1 major phosphate-irrepressible acid phosphatase PhoC [Pseudomonas protegens CHA0]MBP5109261.1 phosphatase PAP2 family protein [Pseudomonas protegens]QTU25692.1 phosphatase PAP2 family protein [Pseudomonas protegens]QTU29327.1 phosphatase PAP2 family protein [Pseudomonas protegens]RLO25468.1 phosphatase PAP2 family protein [Pseudomonas protegens]
MQRLLSKSLASLLFLSLFNPVAAKQPLQAQSVPEFRPGYLIGYLKQQDLPDSLSLLPPPPAVGTPAFALDQSMAEKNQALRGSKRWELAVSDANLKFPATAQTFSCALNAPISEQLTPTLYRVLRRTLADAGLATYSAKKRYQRTRPFVYNQQPSCTPEDEAKLAADGSYPSGHSAIGWAWALLLSELSPEHGNALWARGRAYSQSRMVCNVHWYSDIREGREIGATTVARLHADPTFQADFAVARQELLAVRAQGLTAGADCAAQAQALALDAD